LHQFPDPVHLRGYMSYFAVQTLDETREWRSLSSILRHVRIVH
jgi:hypothetical protein